MRCQHCKGPLPTMPMMRYRDGEHTPFCRAACIVQYDREEAYAARQITLPVVKEKS